ncbi:hypothetical protein F5Y07DRAFT_409016 [Xylaria sp. FL0933]|nr:hypothetical protein F5Y07DRAFT_409016 [Xylaria sp. FL0933]
MVEAVATLAFAANILQFLEAGRKFSTRAYAIAMTGSHSLADLKELRHITEYLHPLLEQLNQGTGQQTAVAATGTQTRLAALSKECSQVVRELLQTLDDAGVSSSRRRKDAIMAAFKLTWHQSTIQKLEHRIGKLRHQLAIDLLVSIREHSCKALVQQEEILNHLRRDPVEFPGVTRTSPNRKQNRNPATDTLGTATLEYLNSRTESQSVKREIEEIRKDIEQLLLGRQGYQDFGRVSGQKYPKIEMDPTKREDVEARIVSSLRYKEMDNRESNIAKAHENTLQWLFKVDNITGRKDTQFRQWLESSEQLYWITGKAGSGKSTLMKYITKSDETTDGGSKCDLYLEKWAGSEDALLVASFYFWASGTSMQASQSGLFRSLLFQLLKKRPKLIQRVAPQVWEASCLFGWAKIVYLDEDLRAMLYSSIKILVEEEKSKVCLFIDGLDEYDGDHHELISICQALARLQNVKMCVSSRPWIVFEDAFHQVPNLMLQEFTYPDIKSFVVSKFTENDGFRRLQLRERTYADTLLENITEKSSGVFLWVQLVVHSLLAGLSYDDRISDLQRRLNFLPPDLEKLYAAILENLDSFYFEHASQYFMLLQANGAPLGALIFSMADEEDPSFALTLARRPFTVQEEEIRIDTLRRRLNSRCKGLLELGAYNTVQYLHRSVKDYIDGREVSERIKSAAGKDFDCNLRICAASLGRVKTSSTWKTRQKSAWKCLEAAAKVEHDTSLMIRILDCLDHVLRETEPLHNLRVFYRSNPDPIDPGHLGAGFLATVARFKVVEYVRARVEAGCLAVDDTLEHDNTTEYPVEGQDLFLTEPSRFQRLMQRIKLVGVPTRRTTNSVFRRRGTWPLLLDATCKPPSFPMFRCLLECGANPNLVFHRGRTPWTEVLTTTLTACAYLPLIRTHAQMADAWAQWVPILQLFLEHGAHLDQRVCRLAYESLDSSVKTQVSQERVVIALKCVATGREELGLGYLNGENNVSVLNKFQSMV